MAQQCAGPVETVWNREGGFLRDLEHKPEQFLGQGLFYNNFFSLIAGYFEVDTWGGG